MRFMGDLLDVRSSLHAGCRACRTRNRCRTNGVTVPQQGHETARVDFAAKIVNAQ
jgi:hypothetical protein